MYITSNLFMYVDTVASLGSMFAIRRALPVFENFKIQSCI